MAHSINLLCVIESRSWLDDLSIRLAEKGIAASLERVTTPGKLRRRLKSGGFDCFIWEMNAGKFAPLEPLEIYQQMGTEVPAILVVEEQAEGDILLALKHSVNTLVLKQDLEQVVSLIKRETLSPVQANTLNADAKDIFGGVEFRSLVENSPAGVFTIDSEYTFVYVNEQMGQILGYPRQELVGTDFRRYIAEDSKALVEDRYKRRQRGEAVPDHYEFNIKRSDGEERTVELSVAVIRSSDGVPLTIGHLLDVTEKKQAMNSLEETASRLERRAMQLRVAAEVARDATSAQSLDLLLARAADLVRDRFGFYHAGIFLIDRNREYAVLKVAAGESGKAMVARKHQLRIGSEGIVGFVAATGEPAVVSDVTQDEHHLRNPLLPETRAELALPLVVAGDVIGVLDVQSDQVNAFDQDDVQILQVMADQLAIAINNAQLLQDTQRKARELSGLYETALVTSSALDIETLLHKLYEQINKLLAPDAFGLALYDDERNAFSLVMAMEAGKSVSELLGQKFSVDNGGLTGWVLHNRQPLMIDDILSDELPAQPKQGGKQVRSWLGVPLIAHDRLVGAISVQSFDVGVFDISDLRLMEAIANQAAIALENARLFEAERKRRQEAETLREVTGALSSMLETDAVINTILIRLREVVPYTAAVLFILQGDCLLVKAVGGEVNDDIVGQAILLEQYPYLQDIITHAEWLQFDDLQTVEGWKDIPGFGMGSSWVGVPLKARKGVIGLLAVEHEEKYFYTGADCQSVLAFANQAAIAIETAGLFEAEQVAREQAETLRDVAEAVGRELDLEQVTRLILRQLKRVLDFDTASVLLYNDDREIDFFVGLGYQDEALVAQEARVLLKESFLLKQMAETLKPVVVEDAQQCPEWVWVPGTEHVRSFMGVPLVAREQMIGAFMVDSAHVSYFAPEDVETVQALAHHMAIAIENIRLVEAERAQLNVSRSLGQVGMLLTSELGLGVVLERILDILKGVVDYDSASIQLIGDDNSMYLAAGRGFPDLDKAKQIIKTLPDSIVLSRFEGGNYYVIPDTSKEENWLVIEGHEYIKSWIGAPLIVRGKMIGVLNLDSRQPNRYRERTGEMVMAFANQAAIAIENARLFDAERLARERAEALSEAARILGSTLALEQIIDVVLIQLERVLPYDTANVMFIEGDSAVIRAGHGYEKFADKSLLTQARLSLKNKTIQKIIRTKQPYVIPDVKACEDWEETIVSKHVRSWLGVPLIVRDKVIGFLGIDRVTPEGFNESEIALAQVFASHTSAAIENARLFAAEEARAEALEMLREVSLGLTATLDRKAVIKALLDGVYDLLPELNNVDFFLYQDGQLIFGDSRWHDGQTGRPFAMPRKEGLTYRVAKSGEMIIVQDILNDSLFSDVPKTEQWHGSIVGIPLKIGKKVIGVLNVARRQTNAFTSEDVRLLQLLTDQASLALENARLFEQATTERKHLALLYDVGRVVGSNLDVDEILQQSIELTCQAMNASLGQACLYLPEKDYLSLRAVYSKGRDKPVELDDRLRLQVQTGLDGWVARNRVAVNVPDVTQDERWRVIPEIDGHIKSAIVAPILDGDTLLGTLSVLSDEYNAFSEDHSDLLNAVCQQAALALSNVQHYQDINRLVDMLAAEQYRLENLIEGLPVGVLMLDKEFRLQVVNVRGGEYLSVLADVHMGDTLTSLGNFPLSEIVSRHREPLPVEVVVEGSRKRVFEIQARRLGEEEEQWVIMISDTTREREFQERIQMQERLATVGQLAAGIAHDFNNIMAAIVVYTDLLLMDPGLSENAKERLHVIQQQVQRASSLIRQILDFSRRSVMEQSELNLIPFVKEIIKLLERTLPETIRIEFIHDDEVYMVMADPTRIQQVFMNLAVNARDAMPKGGTLRFEVGHWVIREDEIPPIPDLSPGDWVRITIADTGEGVPEEMIPHIFEPFFTTKPVGEGTGLGLAQVYGIVKQHGGAIDLETKVGEGTSFHIYLPRLEVNTRQPIASYKMVDMDGEGRTIMVVEDDKATRIALKTLLEVQNFRVLVANNGKDAVAQLEREKDDVFLIVSDLVMPQMGGLDLYHLVRKRWPEIKMLFITGHPLGGNTQTLLERGKVHWLQKPFSMDEFAKAIQGILARQ